MTHFFDRTLQKVVPNRGRFGSEAIASETLQLCDFAARLAMLVTLTLQYCKILPSTVYANTKR
jgi:hypothetical protein